MESNTSKAGIIVAAIVALAIGAFGGYMIGNNMNDMNTNESSSNQQSVKQADLRVALNNALREHVTSSLVVTRNIVDNAPTAKIEGAKAAQTANAVAIATAVGDIYGEDAQTAITTPFVEHIAQSNNYAQAVANGDTMAQATSLSALRAELRKVATVFNSVIPSVPTDTLYDALSAHEDLLNQAAVEYKAGNFEKAYNLENEALVQISGGAEALTTGIVKSKPDMF
ncbi:MAG: hypothetical protein JWO54_492 [Candidatus Saccharibacteria bacterium]|nr:hypothetical protein [Candidatus Saccharibacteria bacterium]